MEDTEFLIDTLLGRIESGEDPEAIVAWLDSYDRNRIKTVYFHPSSRVTKVL